MLYVCGSLIQVRMLGPHAIARRKHGDNRHTDLLGLQTLKLGCRFLLNSSRISKSRPDSGHFDPERVLIEFARSDSESRP